MRTFDPTANLSITSCQSHVKGLTRYATWTLCILSRMNLFFLGDVRGYLSELLGIPGKLKYK